MKKTILITFLFVLMTLGSQCYATTLTVFTEEFPPYNFTNDGKVVGVSTEVVKKILNIAGYKYKLKSYPWARTYSLAQKTQNALIFSISRRPNREDLFKWIGVITPATYSIFCHSSRNDINVVKLSDLKNYRIGTSIDDARESYLLGKGFTTDDFSRIGGSDSNVINLKKLMNNRIDVWPMPDAVAYYTVKQQGYENAKRILKKVLPLSDLSGGYYIAASLNTPESVVINIKTALDKFVNTKEYNRILNGWGLDNAGEIDFAHVRKLMYGMKFFTRIDRVGYLAADNTSSRKTADWLRRGIREEVIESFASNFEEWRKAFIEMQSQVDILILGNNTYVEGWDHDLAEKTVLENTSIPTGIIVDWMAEYAMMGYPKGKLVLNKKISSTLKIKFPASFVKKASMIIE